MAVNGMLKKLAPFLWTIITILVILTTFSAKWGATTEKVRANTEKIEAQREQIADEFKKQEAHNKEWRDDTKDDIKELKQLMRVLIQQSSPSIPR